MSRSNKLFIFLSLTIAAIDILFITSNYYYAHNTLQQNLLDKSTSDYAIFQTIEDSTYNGLAMQANLFSNDSNIQSIFLHGKKALEFEGGGAGGVKTALLRNKLYRVVADHWKNATKKFDIRHFHFHLGPGALSYLRVHQPNKFGDRLDSLRFLIVDTNAEQASKSGFETGRVSSGLRTTAPIFALDSELNKRVYVGALEVSTSFQKILTTIEQNIKIHSSVLLNRQHIEQTVWDEFMDGQYNNNTIKGCDCMLEASSNTEQKKFLEQIAKKIDFKVQILKADREVKILSYKNHTYAVTFHPLRDYLGIKTPERDNIGAIVMSRNIDQLISSYKKNQVFSIVYGIMAYIIIEFLLIITFYKVTRHLSTQITLQTKELSDQKQRIELDKLKYKHLADTINHRYFFYTRNTINNFIFVSPAIKQILDLSPEQFINHSRRYLPKKTRTILAAKNFHLEKRETSFEAEIYNTTGRYQYFLITETANYNNNRQINEIEGLAQDISCARQETMLLKLRCHILQLIADKQSKETVLMALTTGIEAIITDIHCAIMLVDQKNNSLSVAAAPHLPVELVNTLNNLQKKTIHNKDNISCLVAAHTLKRKIIPELQFSSENINSSELLKQEEYKASCSEPVLSSRAKILATIDFYYKQSGTPSKSDLHIISEACDLAARLLEPEVS